MRLMRDVSVYVPPGWRAKLSSAPQCGPPEVPSANGSTPATLGHSGSLPPFQTSAMVLMLHVVAEPAATSLEMSSEYSIFGLPGSDESRAPGLRPMTA